MSKLPFAVCVPWHNPAQLKLFLEAWGVGTVPDWLFLQQDTDRSGCAVTKNRAVKHATEAGAEVIVVLDDDCYPAPGGFFTLTALAEMHSMKLEPHPVKMFETVTNPPSRGTPYFNHRVNMPVAASMGFWTNVGDYDAPAQLVRGAMTPMEFKRETIFGRYFPLCGMNLAFRAEWWPICQFIHVPRFDDIWQGFIWQKIAYSRGFCFNLAGPLVKHSRQSNVWANLRDEAVNLEKNETLWQRIWESPSTDYAELVKLVGT